MLDGLTGAVQRARHVWRPPRASWSYRYQLMADHSGPMSAVHLLAFQECRIRNHAQFEGATDPHPLRGVDDETRADADLRARGKLHAVARERYRSMTTADGDSDE